MPLDSMSKLKLHPRAHVAKCNVEKAPGVSAVGSGAKVLANPTSHLRECPGAGLPRHLPLGKAQTSWVKGRQGAGVNLLMVLIIYEF